MGERDTIKTLTNFHLEDKVLFQEGGNVTNTAIETSTVTTKECSEDNLVESKAYVEESPRWHPTRQVQKPAWMQDYVLNKKRSSTNRGQQIIDISTEE